MRWDLESGPVYDDYVADHTRLKPLFDWLDADFDLARIDELMEIRFSSPENNKYLEAKQAD